MKHKLNSHEKENKDLKQELELKKRFAFSIQNNRIKEDNQEKGLFSSIEKGRVEVGKKINIKDRRNLLIELVSDMLIA